MKNPSILAFALCLLLPAQLRPLSSAGTEFWMAFPANLDSFSCNLSVFATSLVPANVSIQIPSLGFTQNFSLPGGTLVTVPIPLAAILAGGFSAPDELTA